MKNKAASRRDEKLIKGTNIIVKNVSLIDKHRNDPQALLHSIEADDAVELRWWRNALRPEANLIEPAVAYLQGIKVIRPATNFNTFDIKKARLRRLEKQEIERKKCLERRKRDVAPTAAMKASANPYRVPRSGGYIKQKDDRIIQRGEKTKKAAKKDIKESGGKTQRHKSNDEKGKLQKIGKVSSPCSQITALTASHRCKSYVLKFLRGQLPEDLKDVNGALGCLYGTLPDVDEFGQFVISPDVVNSFHQFGYVKMPIPVLDHQQIDKLADEVNELANNVEHHPKTERLYATSLADLTGGPLFFCQGQWRAAWGMHDLIYLPTITVAASQILNNSLVRLWYDEVFMKAARTGPCVPWQQNYARWQHTKPVNHVTVMIALDTMNKDRGAPCLVPGSHRWREGSLLPPVSYDPTKDEAHQLNTIWEIINEEEGEMLMDTPPVTVDLRRGEALLIHPLTLFATHGNRSLDSVRCCFIHYMGEKTYAVQNGPLLPHTTKFQADAMIQGPFYPVVFDPAMTEELTMLPTAPSEEEA